MSEKIKKISKVKYIDVETLFRNNNVTVKKMFIRALGDGSAVVEEVEYEEGMNERAKHISA